MKPTVESLRLLIRRTDPSHAKDFESALKAALEVIVIGSAASGRLSAESDVDLLLVGRGERLKSRHLDLIWIPHKDINTEGWLGSELATHAAHFGVWLKGAGAWRKKTFFSDFAVAHKCERILIRLSRIYLKRHALSRASLNELLARSVLDMQRAVLLASKKPVPPTPVLAAIFLADPAKCYDRICRADLLGTVGTHFTTKFIPRADVQDHLGSKYVR